jgi:hypothetical protein
VPPLPSPPRPRHYTARVSLFSADRRGTSRLATPGSREVASDYSSAHHSWVGRSRAARRDNASDLGRMGNGTQSTRFILPPRPRRAVRRIYQRDRHTVCGFRAVGCALVLTLLRRPAGSSWSAPATGQETRDKVNPTLTSIKVIAGNTVDGHELLKAAMRTCSKVCLLMRWPGAAAPPRHLIAGHGYPRCSARTIPCSQTAWPPTAGSGSG